MTLFMCGKEGLVPNLSNPITCSFSDCRGRACVVCHYGAGELATLKYNSLDGDL